MLKIYLELDGILDTRLPMAMLIDEKAALRAIRDGKAYSRFKDNYDYIPASIIDPFYRKRNKQLLRMATLTTLIEDVVIYQVLEYRANYNRQDEDTKYWVNYYPYDLDRNEVDILTEYLAEALVTRDIELISKNNLEVSAKWVSENVDVMYKYDGLAWLELQGAIGDLADNPLVFKNLIIPFISSYGIPEESMNEQFAKQFVDSFQPVIDITLIDSKYFAARYTSDTNNPLRTKEETKTNDNQVDS